MTITDGLRNQVASAIFDPGATEGLKGERSMTEWQTDAVMRVLSGAGVPDGQICKERIDDVCAEEAHSGASFGWRSCSGCHETFEGHSVGKYPHSKIFGCEIGSGCSECGGLGVVWEYWSKSALDAMQRDLECKESDDRLLTPDEMAAQALRCPCHGSDDYCACQNVPDRETRALRSSSMGEE